MARKVFFSFHYQQDIFRVNVIRKHALTKGGYQISGYQDRSLWEQSKTNSPLALKRMINSALKNTSVTVVLIGAQTAGRRWIEYEIEKSYERGNGIIGVYIHNIRSARTQKRSHKGVNPLDNFQVTLPTSSTRARPLTASLAELCPTYDWGLDRGYDNFSKWVEQAARQAGK